MIVEDIHVRLSFEQRHKHIDKGVIFDSHVLLIFFLDLYIREHESKRYILKRCNITKSQIDCVNHVLGGYRIKNLIITPYIFAEFLNKIRSKLKEDYKIIKKEFITQLLEIGEIQIDKNIIIKHESFVDFGNDISLLEAAEKQVRENKYSCILSFDERFINKFFRQRDNILAFNLNVLQYFYL